MNPPTSATLWLATTPGAIGQLRETLPRPLVFTYGVFDILNAGHVACLQQARERGRSVVVGLYSDASARKLCKHPGSPTMAAAQRASVLSALAAVSAVVLFDEQRPLALMCALRPDIHVRGPRCHSAQWAESALMAEWGGHTVTLARHGGAPVSTVTERARRQAIEARSRDAGATRNPIS